MPVLLFSVKYPISSSTYFDKTYTYQTQKIISYMKCKVNITKKIRHYLQIYTINIISFSHCTLQKSNSTLSHDKVLYKLVRFVYIFRKYHLSACSLALKTRTVLTAHHQHTFWSVFCALHSFSQAEHTLSARTVLSPPLPQPRR